MCTRIKIKFQKTTIIQVNADWDFLNNSLQTAVYTVQKQIDILLILSERIERTWTSWNGVLNKYGEPFADFCTVNSLDKRGAFFLR